jgi:hypothetical protein
MLVPLAGLTPEQLKAADVIFAVDPKASYREQVCGQGVVPAMRPSTAGPHTIRVLDVRIDSSQSAQFQELLRLVEAAKGWLHPEVEALKM